MNLSTLTPEQREAYTENTAGNCFICKRPLTTYESQHGDECLKCFEANN